MKSMKQIARITLVVILLAAFFGINGSSAADGIFNGTYSIIASHSGKAVDTWEWGTTDGTNIAQYDYWEGDAQKFIVKAVDGSWHTISPVISSNQAVEVADGSSEAGANIQTFSNWGHACQQWRFEEAGNGEYHIINRNSNLCMSVADSSMDDGANVAQLDCINTPNQTFTLVKHSSSTSSTGDNGCLENVTNFRPGQGPFQFRRDTQGVVKMWVPQLPAGCKAPIVHLSNGTYATCSMYGTVLQNLAEYGFMAICYENINTGQGTQALTAIDTAINKYPNLVDRTKLGFTGHSQGGAGTFTALYRAQGKYPSAKLTGVAMQPAANFGSYPANWRAMFSDIRWPVAMFNGTFDTLVYEFYAAMSYNNLPANGPKVWYTATGVDSTHIPVPNNPGRQITVPWFYWMLLDNQAACRAFKALPSSGPGQWRRHSEKNMPACN